MRLYGDKIYCCDLKRNSNKSDIYPILKFYNTETMKYINTVEGNIGELETIIETLQRGGWRVCLDHDEKSVHHAIVKLTGN